MEKEIDLEQEFITSLKLALENRDDWTYHYAGHQEINGAPWSSMFSPYKHDFIYKGRLKVRVYTTRSGKRREYFNCEGRWFRYPEIISDLFDLLQYLKEKEKKREEEYERESQERKLQDAFNKLHGNE